MQTSALPLIPWCKTSILVGRKSAESSKFVLVTALDLFVLGFTAQGNKLLDALQEYGRGEENYDSSMRATSDTLHMASKDQKPLPAWRKPRDLIIEWEKGVPGETARRFKYGILTNGDVSFVLERLNVLPGVDNTDKSVTIGAAAQVALLAGDKMVTTKLVNENIKGLYRRLQDEWDTWESDGDELRTWLDDRLGLHFAPEIWRIVQKANLGESLNVSEEALDAFVNEGCALIKQRFTQGPLCPYANKTVKEILHLIDENYAASYRTRIGARPAHYFNARSITTLPNSYLRSGASEEITTLMERLFAAPKVAGDDDSDDWDYDDGEDYIERIILPEKELPEDYKDFLRVSNGLSMRQDSYQNLVLHSIERVTKGAKWLHSLDYQLFPHAYAMEGVNYISLAEFTCFIIGFGNGEFQVILIPPSSVKPVVQRFEKIYEEAKEEHKKVYDRVALEIYGGLDKVWALEWLCVLGRHDSNQQTIWGSFKSYLEWCIEDAVKADRMAKIEVKKFQEREAAKNIAKKQRREKRKRELSDEGGAARA